MLIMKDELAEINIEMYIKGNVKICVTVEVLKFRFYQILCRVRCVF
jgi:hypothetical protein